MDNEFNNKPNAGRPDMNRPNMPGANRPSNMSSANRPDINKVNNINSANRPNITRPIMPNANRPSSMSSINRPDANGLNSNGAQGSRPSPNPMLAEEKLKRSLKGLSHIGGGAIGSSLNHTSQNKIDTSQRKKVGGVVLDLETIEDVNKQNYEGKTKRNNVIIFALCIMLVASLIYLAVAIANFNKSKKDFNFSYVVEGDVNAQWIVEGGEKVAFNINEGLSCDTFYWLDSELSINTSDEVTLQIEIQVFVKGEHIVIEGLHLPNENLEREDGTNIYNYNGTLTSGKYHIFSALDFHEAPASLNSQTTTIKVIARVNKV